MSCTHFTDFICLFWFLMAWIDSARGKKGGLPAAVPLDPGKGAMARGCCRRSGCSASGSSVMPVALNKVRVLLSPSWFRMPSATSLDARETMCNVEVSTEIYVQQEPRELSYSNIVFVTALHFNKLKKSFGTEGEEGNNMVSNASYMSSFYIQLLPFCFAIFFSF